MGKVVTSQGLTEFVQSGKVENIKGGKSDQETPPPEVVKAAPIQDVGKPEKAEAKAEATEAAVEAVVEAKSANKSEKIEDLVKELGLDKEFSQDELKAIGDRVTRSMAQRHRRMREAQESAAEAERFAEQRFNELRQVERERDGLQQKLQEASKARESAQESAKKEPTAEDFKNEKGEIDWIGFVNARSQWSAEQAVIKDRQAREREAKEQAAKANEEAAAARFQAARDKYDDFAEVMEQAQDILIQNSVLQYLAESELGPDLTYYLIKHPDEVERIRKLSPVAAVAAVGKLEDKLGESSGTEPSKSAQVLPRTQRETGGAPAPITPLGNGIGTIPKDPSKMNFRELRDYERARKAAH